METKKNKDAESVNEMKAILRSRIDDIAKEKQYDTFTVTESIIKRIGVGNLDIYIDQFKRNFSDCIPKKPKISQKEGSKEKPKEPPKEPEKEIKIKILSGDRDSLKTPKRRRRK